MGKDKGVLGRLYGIVRAFLHDFYVESKKGTIKHLKGVIIFLSFVFLCVMVLMVAAYKVSEQPFFCGLCHNMKVYVDSWKASKHRNVSCIYCHYKPGFKNHLIGKWKDGQVSLVYFVTGKVITRPHAEIHDISCLQSSCHKKDDLKKNIVFKNVVFNHTKHLATLPHNMQLRCTSCHSQIEQGVHMNVTETNCFICHFYTNKKQKKYATDCTSCHSSIKADISRNGVVFSHNKYIQRGVSCETCHTNVIHGDGSLGQNTCQQCHNKRSIFESKYDPAELHKKHVTDHKVECFSCHSPIKHKSGGFEHVTTSIQTCSQCHENNLHKSETLMYTGKGTRFQETPSRKAMLKMDCSVCHKRGQPKSDAGGTCKSCHGDFTEGMVALWKERAQKDTALLTQDINDLKNKALSPSDRKKLDTLVADNTYLSKGKPLHNILFALSIIEKDKQLVAKLKGNPSASVRKPANPGDACMSACHANIGEKKVAFGKTFFPHEMHISGDDSCIKCHTPYGKHGGTHLTGCSSCHHGEGAGKVTCQDCHGKVPVAKASKKKK